MRLQLVAEGSKQKNPRSRHIFSALVRSKDGPIVVSVPVPQVSGKLTARVGEEEEEEVEKY